MQLLSDVRRLQEILAWHGFDAAAARIDPIVDLELAIESWRNYPRCLDHHATQLRPPRQQ
jgi:hypothetical protein